MQAQLHRWSTSQYKHTHVAAATGCMVCKLSLIHSLGGAGREDLPSALEV